jgi:hypothetical protein
VPALCPIWKQLNSGFELKRMASPPMTPHESARARHQPQLCRFPVRFRRAPASSPTDRKGEWLPPHHLEAIRLYGHVMFCASHIDPRCIYIRWWKSFGRIHFPGCLPSLARLLRAFRHRLIPPTEVRRTRPGCDGVEPADQSQPTATNSLIARNRSRNRKRAQGRHSCRGLDCRVRRSQHLSLIPFLVPLTAPRCPLFGSNPV